MSSTRQTSIFLAATSAFVFGLVCVNSGGTSAQQPNPLTGRWVNVVLSEQASGDPQCRYMEVMTRRYDLAGGSNGSIHGIYSRMRELLWLTKATPDCDFLERKRLTDGYLRADTWLVQGNPLESGIMVDIVGHYDRCLGDCDRSLAIAENFTTRVKLEGRRFYDMGDRPPESLLLFVADSVKEEDELQANESFRRLLQPLLDGDCNSFYRNSTDQMLRRVISQELFCQLGRRVSDLIPTVSTDEPLFAYRVTLGSLHPPNGSLQLLTDGDVIVQRFFVISGAGGGIPIGAVLRKQSDGSWKVAVFAP